MFFFFSEDAASVITCVIIKDSLTMNSMQVVDGGKTMSVLKVTTVATSVGVILPKEIPGTIARQKGDSLYAIETKNGIELTAYDSRVRQTSRDC